MSDIEARSLANAASSVESTSHWVLVGPTIFVLGQLIMLLLIPRNVPDSIILGAEALLLGILGLSLLRAAPRVRTVVAYLVTVGLFGGIQQVGRQNDMDVWLLGLTLVSSIAVVLYVVHRYGRVRMGLVSTGTQVQDQVGGSES